MTSALLIVFAFMLGAVIGSFLNVVIYRLPARKSVVFPPSSCPSCGTRLGPAELVPIFSWVLQRGRCKHCGARISARYPAVEALTGLLFAAAAWLRPELPELVLVWAFIAILVVLSFIDIDTYTVPDGINFGGLFLGLLAAALLAFPRPFNQALDAALICAGVVALIGSYGSLIVRRGRDGRREFPVGLHTLHLAAMVGAWFGPAAGLVAGFVNWALNARTRRVWALPDGLTLGLAALGPVVAYLLPDWPFESLRGLLIAAGGLALTGGLYWAFQPEGEEDEDEGEVVVMGFGDVKLAGLLGAWVGVGPFLVGLMVAVVAGAVIGLALRERKVPFVPYLALGGLVAFFFGQDLINWYLSYLGVGP